MKIKDIPPMIRFMLYSLLVMMAMTRMTFLTKDTHFIISMMVYFYFSMKNEVKKND